MTRWQYVPLEAVANIVNGFSFKSGDFSADNNIKSVKITNVGVQEFIEQTDSLLPSNFMEKYASYQVSSGDIVIALTRTLISSGLKVAIVPVNFDKALLNQRVAAIKPSPELLNNRFLYYFFASQMAYDFVKSSVNELMQPNLSIKDLRNLSLPVPPLTEQKHIVAIIDHAFADIDQARATAEINLKNARELFESSLQKIFGTKGEHWERVSLEEMLNRKWIADHLDGNHGGDYPKKNEFVEAGVPYISAKCLINGKIDMSKSKFLTSERAGKLRTGIAINEDVLFAHNATVGPVAILRTDKEKVILGTSLTCYRCNKEYILPEYLSQYMVSYAFTSQYTSIMRQSTRNQVPISKQREFIHIIPPVSEQADIAKSLGDLSGKLERLEEIYLKKIVFLDELKKSILHKAFTGELTKSKGIAA